MCRALLLLLGALLLAASSASGQQIISKYGASPFSAIDVDVATGNTFAISGANIVCSDINGNFISAFTLPPALSAAPAAIAISRTTSVLYVTDSLLPQRIIALSTKGALLNVFPLTYGNNSAFTAFTYFSGAIALDGSDNVYLIACQSQTQFRFNATVARFNATATGLVFASQLACNTDFTVVPSATTAANVAVNQDGSAVVVGMNGTDKNQVVQYSAADGSVQWSVAIYMNGWSAQQPVAVLQSTGDVFYADNGNFTVVRSTSSGVFNASYPLGQRIVSIALDAPHDRLYALPGSLYIAKWMTSNAGFPALPYLPPSNSYIAIVAPVAVAAVPSMTMNGTVAVAGSSGVILLSKGSPTAVLTNQQFLSAGQFAVDSNQNFYFPAAATVNEYSPQFTVVQQFEVSRQLGLSSPQAVAVDSKGNLFVADTVNNRIALFTASGYPQLMLTGSNPQLYAPQALQLFDDALYALDANGRLVQFATSNGQQTAVIIDTGGALVNPVALSIDAAGQFYIADAFLQRVTQHSSSGQLLAVLTNSSSPITRPTSLAVDSVNSLLYIVDQTGYPNSNLYIIRIPNAQPVPHASRRELHEGAMLAEAN